MLPLADLVGELVLLVGHEVEVVGRGGRRRGQLLVVDPLLVLGASLITRLIERFPVLIWFGGGLLGCFVRRLLDLTRGEELIMDFQKKLRSSIRGAETKGYRPASARVTLGAGAQPRKLRLVT